MSKFLLLNLSLGMSFVFSQDNPWNMQETLPPDVLRLAAEPYKSGTLNASGSTSVKARNKVRLLYSFEDGQDGQPVREFMRSADNIDVIHVQDNGITDGKWCARVTGKQGAPWSTVELRGEALKNWGDYDYFAMDLMIEDEHPYGISLELWDQDSRNYHTRCTFTNPTRPGRQTMLYQINRSKRNGKEGRDWDELEAKDKIDLNKLAMIKIFTTPLKDRPVMFWIDNLRLMQEDAAKPKMLVELPKATTAAFDFGSAGAAVPGFQAVTADTKLNERTSFGLNSPEKLTQGGKGWPDLLSGTYVHADHNKQLSFAATVPNGDYLVWLCAGPILGVEHIDPTFLLKLNGKVIHEDKPEFRSYDSEKYLYRFLWTQYSERPDALWLDYVSRMFPVHEDAVKVTDGTISLEAVNYFVSSLILLPASQSADFKAMKAKILKTRMEAFESTIYTPERERPKPVGEEKFVVYVPDDGKNLLPWTAPSEQERARKKIQVGGTAGQNVFMRLAVTSFDSLGMCSLELADLKAENFAISASHIRGHVKNYRYAGRDVGEMGLIPTLSFLGEKGLTQDLWLWLRVPEDAKPGNYSAMITLKTANSGGATIPVEVEVYPFKLEQNLPVSFGMYYSGRYGPKPPQGEYWDVIRGQLRWMKKLGFTSTSLMSQAVVTGVNNGKVSLKTDGTGAAVLKAEGFGQHPGQLQMTSQLGIARAIGRRLFPSQDHSGSPVDKNPGIEFTSDQFKGLWLDAMKQYRAFLDSLGVAYAVESVDEPREVPNPWNRNLKDTNTYGAWMKEVGFTTRFVTPMSDEGGGKNYSSLVDYADIVSLHAWPRSQKLLQKTKTDGKTLWFYNSGMNRLAWGLYPWAQGATGRWEWHWSFPEPGGDKGYPGSDWYNPFTSIDAVAPNAPVAKYQGGFLYKSSFLNTAEGITDYAYLYTLKLALERHTEAGTKAAEVAQAKGYLEKLRARVPEFPEGDSLKAGTGMSKSPGELVGVRAEIAELLKSL